MLREEAAWRFKERYMTLPADDYVEAMRTGVKLANSRGVTCVHDKDGWLGALGLWQRLEAQGSLSLRVWQSVPADLLPELRGLSLRSGFGSPLLRVGYLKVFMDGTLGSETAWMLDGSGVRDHERRRARRDRARRRSRRLAGRRARDRRPRESRGARRVRADARRVAARGAAAAHRARAVPIARGPTALRRARCRGLGAVHARAVRRAAREALLGRSARGTYAFRSLLDCGALVANGSDAPIEELDPWAGVVAAVLRHWRVDQRLTLAQAIHATCVAPAWLSHDERSRGTLVPGRLADLVVLDRDPFACEHAELPEVQVVATMVGGPLGAQPAALGLSWDATGVPAPFHV